MTEKLKITGGTLYLDGTRLCEFKDMNIDTEQWKIDGDCTKCRRQRYCSKPCKKQREKRASEWDEARAMMAAKVFERVIKGGQR